MTSTQDLRVVAKQLLELTGLSIAELARRGELHRPNCLAWLAGKEQVLSEKKQLAVCELLGWRFGRLRRDMVHRWETGNDLSALKQILMSCEGSDSGTTLAIYQADGVPAERAAVIIGVCEGLDPLVILVRRPLGYGMPELIGATALGMGHNGNKHNLSMPEWHQWWLPDGAGSHPDEYLRTYGGALLEATALAPRPSMNGIVECASIRDDLPLDPGILFGNSDDEIIWIDLLKRAKQSGLSIEEIVLRTEKTFGLEIKFP